MYYTLPSDAIKPRIMSGSSHRFFIMKNVNLRKREKVKEPE